MLDHARCRATGRRGPSCSGDLGTGGPASLAEANAAIIWWVTPDGSSLEGEGWDAFCSEAVEKKRRDWWFRTIHPDDRERVCSAWHDALQAGGSYSCEFRIRHLSGEYRWVADRGVPLTDENGIIEEWVGAISDIHEHKQAEEALRASEERLRLALETTSTGTWDANLVTGHRQWTAEALQILGISADALITRDSFFNCVHPGNRAEVEGKFFVDWPANGPGYSGTYRIIRADNGEERWVAATGRTLLDENGRPVRKVSTLQNITHRKRAEEALKASEERLRLALDGGRMVAWERDLATEHVVRSANALTLLGIGSGSFSEFLQRVHPEDRPQADLFIQRANDQAPDTAEFRYMLPNGRMLWLGARAENVEPDRLIGITFDITDRKAGPIAPVVTGLVLDVGAHPADWVRTALLIAGGLAIPGALAGVALIDPDADRARNPLDPRRKPNRRNGLPGHRGLG